MAAKRIIFDMNPKHLEIIPGWASSLYEGEDRLPPANPVKVKK